MARSRSHFPPNEPEPVRARAALALPRQELVYGRGQGPFLRPSFEMPSCNAGDLEPGEFAVYFRRWRRARLGPVRSTGDHLDGLKCYLEAMAGRASSRMTGRLDLSLSVESGPRRAALCSASRALAGCPLKIWMAVLPLVRFGELRAKATSDGRCAEPTRVRQPPSQIRWAMSARRVRSISTTKKRGSPVLSPDRRGRE